MKLYYWPGACSLSPHIVSREAGIDLQLAQLDRAERKTADGTVLSSVNPKNQVPVLEMDDGQKLTEGPVIVQYLADLKPASGLVPPPGSVRALPRPGMAQLHQLGAAQDLFAAVPPDHAGRLQGSLA
jgi:glutathione S-transferase